MKYSVATFLLLLAALITPVAYALTSEDVELLILLGVVDADKVEAVRSLVGTQTQVNNRSREEVVAAPSACLSFDDNILLGNQGTAVTRLQQFLRTEGYFTYPENTGYYGPATQAAVVQFQLATGLITSATQRGAGNVGPVTRAKIKELSCGNQPTVATSAPTTMSIEAGLIYEDQERGQHRIEYVFEIDDDTHLDTWHVKLVCAEDEVSVSGEGFDACNEEVDLSGSRSRKTIKLRFQNETDFVQSVGLLVEARDENNTVIATDEVINNLRIPSEREWIPFDGYLTYDGGGDGPIVDPPAPDPENKFGCVVTPENDILARWTEASSERHPITGRTIAMHALPASNISSRAQSETNRFVIVEPNGRTLAQIYDDYKDDYDFPNHTYVKYMDDLGETYYNTDKQTIILSRRKEFLPSEETPAILEKKRQGIQGLVSAIPALFTTYDRIASNDYIVALGEIHETSTGSALNIPGFKWNWHGREFGVFYDKYFTYNGSIGTADRAVTPCTKLQNNDYDILLIRK